MHQVLGTDVQPDVLERLFVQSGGNALFLEELLRTIADGAPLEKADTVIAMLQARFGRLAATTRRSLRAASLFGHTFWTSGVAAVLGEGCDARELEAGLSELLSAELIERHPESCFPGEQEYVFHHALVREAAYGLLLPEDLRIGHRRAGEYLKSMGEPNPLPIAEHLEQGGALPEALKLYLEAAEQSLGRGDSAGALAIVERARRCGVSGEALGHLLAIQAQACDYTLDRTAASRLGQEALPLLRVGSRLWYRSSLIAGSLTVAQGNRQALQEWAKALLEAQPERDAVDVSKECIAGCISNLCAAGEFTQARQLYEHSRSLAVTAESALVHPMLTLAQSQYLRAAESDPFRQLELLKAALLYYEESGSQNMRAIVTTFVGEAQGELGDLTGGEQTLRTALSRAQQAKHDHYVVHAQLHLAALLSSGPERAHWEEAAALARAALATDRLSLGYREWSHFLLARALLRLGELVEAEAEAQRALELTETAPLRRILGIATRVEALLALGRSSDASEQARRGLAVVERLGSAGYAEVPIRLAAAQSFLREGLNAEAERELLLAHQEISRRASLIPDLDARTRYLTAVPENARVMALVQERERQSAS